MISPQKAIEAATKLVADIYGDDGARSVRVEELDRVAKEGAWHVTLSFFPPSDLPDVSEAMRSILTPERIYKTFEVDAESGAVLSMKIRELQ
ncbi:MAG: PepSY domain-containing protein [Bryobacterales bacterium]|nr:PepSY domain-containing protein [Acidobacteriota bacterium]MCB9384110.1 PepSY domain-containing protein [Bryobacterales bacterium]